MIDNEIQDLITNLNSQGFTTVMSCAGHRNSGKACKVSRGWISFAEHYDQETIRILCEGYGLSDIRIGLDIDKTLLVTYSPIGQPSNLYELEDGEIYDAIADRKALEAV